MDALKPTNFAFAHAFTTLFCDQTYTDFYQNNMHKFFVNNYFLTNVCLQVAANTLQSAIVVINANTCLAPTVIIPQTITQFENLIVIVALFHARLFMPVSYTIKRYNTVKVNNTKKVSKSNLNKDFSQSNLGPYISGKEWLELNEYYTPQTYEQPSYLKRCMELMVNESITTEITSLTPTDIFKCLHYSLQTFYKYKIGKIIYDCLLYNDYT